MTMRPSRGTRHAVIGHPVGRARPVPAAGDTIAKAIERRATRVDGASRGAPT
ncbi:MULTISPECIES: hypothetical protein [Gordonia]|jgi:hypothetical protein|uniref:hypothetical protein n=1 Tax=Gordonia TaxID=2053 RepID=UPI0032B44275